MAESRDLPLEELGAIAKTLQSIAKPIIQALMVLIPFV